MSWIRRCLIRACSGLAHRLRLVTLLVRYAGSQEKKLGPGSYSEIPANMVHAVKCLEDAACVFVLASPDAFAIIPASPGDNK